MNRLWIEPPQTKEELKNVTNGIPKGVNNGGFAKRFSSAMQGLFKLKGNNQRRTEDKKIIRDALEGV